MIKLQALYEDLQWKERDLEKMDLRTYVSSYNHDSIARLCLSFSYSFHWSFR